MWCWGRIAKIKWPKKVTIEQVLGCIGRKRTIINNIQCWKRQLYSTYSKKKLPFNDVIEGHMTKVKGLGRRRTQLLDDLRNRRRH